MLQFATVTYTVKFTTFSIPLKQEHSDLLMKIQWANINN